MCSFLYKCNFQGLLFIFNILKKGVGYTYVSGIICVSMGAWDIK